MNSRERFRATLAFELVDRTLLWEFGYWGGTVRRWYGEGLPQKVGIPDSIADGSGAFAEAGSWDEGERPREFDIHNHLGLDEGLRCIPLNNFFCPVFETRVLEDTGEWVVWVDKMGVTRRDRNDKATLSQFVRAPVESRQDWQRLKEERLQPTLEGRLPAFWPRLLEEYRARDYPLSIGGRHGYYGTPRFLLGEERVLTTFYDDPALIEDINATLTDFWIALYDQVLAQVRPKPDAFVVWEDMCYRAGPLISPTMFRRFMLPYYKKLTGFFRDHGINIVLVDTDGNFTRLIPLFVEGGVTAVYPYEIAAGMDPVAVRQAFPRFGIMGGIDKMKIAAGKEQIDAELAARVPFLLRHGGYIPYIAHLVPPDVSWENFLYYRERLKALVLDAAQPRGVRQSEAPAGPGKRYGKLAALKGA